MNKKEFFQMVNGKVVRRTKAAPIRRAGSDSRAFSSLGSGIGNAVKQDIPVYTGDAMIGIGQLHKSNAIPVFSKEDAINISKMRRG